MRRLDFQPCCYSSERRKGPPCYESTLIISGMDGRSCVHMPVNGSVSARTKNVTDHSFCEKGRLC